MKRRRNSKKKRSYKVPALIVVIVLCVTGAMAFQIRSLKKTDEAYAAKESSLRAEEAAESSRSAALDAEESYIQTKQYIEDIARSRLGLVYPDETIIKPQS